MQGSTQEQTASNLLVLLQPLELIAASDDSSVQAKAVEALRLVSNLLPDTMLGNEYLELVRRLKKGDMYSMRVAACNLYSHIYGRLEPEKKEIVRKKFKKLCEDDTPMVRWGAAQSISTYAKNLEQE